MAFLCQIDLAELHSAEGPDWLPHEGILLFFYDLEKRSWGFSPDDRGSWAVIYQPAPLSIGQIAPTRLVRASFPAHSLTPRPHLSLPSPERLGIASWDLDDASWNAVDTLLDANYGNPPWHQVGGWPRPIQNDNMELECQLVSNGIYCGGPQGYRSKAAKALAPGASDWRLLLQLDSDEASEMNWEDGGTLYFWVREQDARAGDFSNVWLILQCT